MGSGKGAFAAAIFDLDGVVTRTARVHAAAWKELFDVYLGERSARLGEVQRPFDIKEDYLRYVDGKPRYEGVRSFLASRGIEIPFGDATDGPDQETACGLGNRKDHYFARRLHEQGAEIFDSTVVLIRDLRIHGIKTAVVTSSKHGHEIIQMCKLSDMFDVEIDGNAVEELGLSGKPDPDAFLEAAQKLGVQPQRTVVFEDAASGVEAASRGGFGLVIGIDRGGNAQTLARYAHIVVKDAAELSVADMLHHFEKLARPLPSALDNLDEISRALNGKRLAVFLDYDGTLTPIVARPELAVLAPEMRESLRRLASVCTTAIVSGRALKDVAALVDVPELVYSGNHGFEIRGPDGTSLKHDKGQEYQSTVALARDRIAERIKGVTGAFVEDKTYSLSVHYRLAPEERVGEIEAVVDSVLADLPELRKHFGKKVFEVRPRMEWDKGRAVLWLLSALELDKDDVLPMYIGDDVTDEDAFRALAGKGLGLFVAADTSGSAATYSLKDTDQVRQLLEALVVMVGEARR
ncbi:MAG: trehalose-phosphatase [Chitinispirillaceae bacterium]|nr:trehalose-phosphatase [Chitinispirillaceae bacterium]